MPLAPGISEAAGCCAALRARAPPHSCIALVPHSSTLEGAPSRGTPQPGIVPH